MLAKIEICVHCPGMVTASIEGSGRAVYEGIFAILGDLLERDLKEGHEFDEVLNDAMQEIKRIQKHKITSKKIDNPKEAPNAGDSEKH